MRTEDTTDGNEGRERRREGESTRAETTGKTKLVRDRELDGEKERERERERESGVMRKGEREKERERKREKQSEMVTERRKVEDGSEKRRANETVRGGNAHFLIS